MKTFGKILLYLVSRKRTRVKKLLQSKKPQFDENQAGVFFMMTEWVVADWEGH